MHDHKRDTLGSKARRLGYWLLLFLTTFSVGIAIGIITTAVITGETPFSRH